MEKGTLRSIALAMAITPALSPAYDLTPDGVSVGYGHYPMYGTKLEAVSKS